MTMSDATPSSACQATTTIPGFEALRPTRSFWSVGVVGLICVLVAALVWASPGLTHPPLRDWTWRGGTSSPAIGGFPLASGNVNAYLAWAPVEVTAIGGATIIGIEPVAGVTFAGAWVLDSSQRDQLQAAFDEWYRICVDDNGNLSGTAAVCQLPSGNAQSGAFLATLVGLGAPLDATTAVPRFLPNRMDGTLVILWSTTQCGIYTNGDVVVQTRRFGVPGSATVSFPTWPSC